MYKILTTEELKYYLERYPAELISTDWEMVYEGQIPIGAIIIVEGEALLTKKNRLYENLPPGSFFGLKELKNKLPSKLCCRIKGGSKIIMLSRFAVEHMDDKGRSNEN